MNIVNLFVMNQVMGNYEMGSVFRLTNTRSRLNEIIHLSNVGISLVTLIVLS